MTETPILQFGTSRFLQAHADLFVSDALPRGDALGHITVVQSTGDPGRAGRLAGLTVPQGYPVHVRGLENGAVVDRVDRVTSVRRALSTAIDWEEVVRIAVDEAEIILSNTGDAGFAPRAADGAAQFDQDMSYPSKLCLLLRARFDSGAAPVQVMPTELVSDNGHVLKRRVMELAASHPQGFSDYLSEAVTWVNSLVDRIVSQPLEPAGAVAEPYALWAIEAQDRLLLPCRHPAIRVDANLERAESLKLFLLNLAHTMLAEDWLASPGEGPQLVREVMAEPERRAAMIDLYETELLPGFDAAGLGGVARDYVAVTLERFSNPFLDHRLADIAQNHKQKIGRRAVAFLAWAAQHGDVGPKPQLRALAAKA